MIIVRNLCMALATILPVVILFATITLPPEKGAVVLVAGVIVVTALLVAAGLANTFKHEDHRLGGG